MTSSALSPSQIVGNICVAVATVVFLLLLQNVMWDWTRRETSANQFTTPILLILVPIWLLMMGALLCATANGGFDWLRLGRPALYVFSVAASVALATVSFVFIALYLRPGFTPRGLYSPVIFLVHFATVLLVVVSLNPKLPFGTSMQWLRWPWTIFTGLSLIGSLVFLGFVAVRAGKEGLTNLARRVETAKKSPGEILAHVAALDPEKNFKELLNGANRHQSREVREAATARLRSSPKFLDLLTTELEDGHVEPAIEFIHSATLSASEQSRLARPARDALERWVNRIPAPNYTTKDNLRRLRRWGEEMLPVVTKKFPGTDVDFAEVIADFDFRISGK